MTTFEGYGSSLENLYSCRVNPSLKSHVMQEFSSLEG